MADGEDEGVVEVGGVFGEERMVAADWRDFVVSWGCDGGGCHIIYVCCEY